MELGFLFFPSTFSLVDFFFLFWDAMITIQHRRHNTHQHRHEHKHLTAFPSKTTTKWAKMEICTTCFNSGFLVFVVLFFVWSRRSSRTGFDWLGWGGLLAFSFWGFGGWADGMNCCISFGLRH
ncbi:hypothetical protein BKA81DRAFT_41560 [Phyllosticta paracitricarpa]|uniref:Transmembrane protein n=1 Tax=Phyllosticta paracitricarpa TaxID=2016321 RepID=A0ABR1NJX6_9PEZI